MRTVNWPPPVVFSRVHLCVLHPELLGKQHEGVHWSLALGGCVIAFRRAWIPLSVWPLTRRAGGAMTLSFCGFLKEATGLWLSFSFKYFRKNYLVTHLCPEKELPCWTERPAAVWPYCSARTQRKSPEAWSQSWGRHVRKTSMWSACCCLPPGQYFTSWMCQRPASCLRA